MSTKVNCYAALLLFVIGRPALRNGAILMPIQSLYPGSTRATVVRKNWQALTLLRCLWPPCSQRILCCDFIFQRVSYSWKTISPTNEPTRKSAVQAVSSATSAIVRLVTPEQLACARCSSICLWRG